jgi:hypothetical protein
MHDNGAPCDLFPFPRTYDTPTWTSEGYLPGEKGFLPRTVNEAVRLSYL